MNLVFFQQWSQPRRHWLCILSSFTIVVCPICQFNLSKSVLYLVLIMQIGINRFYAHLDQSSIWDIVVSLCPSSLMLSSESASYICYHMTFFNSQITGPTTSISKVGRNLYFGDPQHFVWHFISIRNSIWLLGQFW